MHPCPLIVADVERGQHRRRPGPCWPPARRRAPRPQRRLSAGPRPRPWEATTSAASSGPGAPSARRPPDGEPSGAPSCASASAIGVSPTTSSSGAAAAAPGRSPVRRRTGRGWPWSPRPPRYGPATSPGTIRSSSGPCVDTVISPYPRTERPRAGAADEPSMVPSSRTSAGSPAWALVGAARARRWPGRTGSRVAAQLGRGVAVTPYQIGGVGRPCMAAHTLAGVRHVHVPDAELLEGVDDGVHHVPAGSPRSRTRPPPSRRADGAAWG